jgi:hypothetical protein
MNLKSEIGYKPYYGSSLWANSVLKRVIRIAQGIESKVYPSNLVEIRYYLGILNEFGFRWHYYVGSSWYHKFLALHSADLERSDSHEGGGFPQ